MKITVLGSCRQYSLRNIYNVTSIQEAISYPHYTKEILEVINFCKFGTLKPEETLYVLRTAILNNKPIYFNEILKEEFESSDIFILEIASKKKYKYNNKYVHHITTEVAHNKFIKDEIKNNIEIIEQDKNEVEEDIINIKNLLNKPLIIISHLVTKNIGERYNLKCWLEEICTKHNIIFIDPIRELQQRGHNIAELFNKENVMAHYNDLGHLKILEIYKEYIDKIIL